jgi:hypothetical protein
MSPRLVAAFCLSLLASASIAQAAPPFRTEKQTARSTSVLATKALRRIQHEVKAGVPDDQLKLPEGAETLDFMIESLKALRATHAPPPKQYVALSPADELPEDLAARIENPDHPRFKEELKYIDAMLERAQNLKRDGIPYLKFVEFTLNGFNRAMSLKLDPREGKSKIWEGKGLAGLNKSFPFGRAESLDLNHIDGGWYQVSHEKKAKDMLFFPTHKELSQNDFNLVAHRKIAFLGATTETHQVDHLIYGALTFPGHDLSHGYNKSNGLANDLKNNGKRAAQLRVYRNALAHVKDAEVRTILEWNYFNATHESSATVSASAASLRADIVDTNEDLKTMPDAAFERAHEWLQHNVAAPVAKN